MPVSEPIILGVTGGFDGDSPKDQTGAAMPFMQNVRGTIGGDGIEAWPGHVRTLAFSLWDRYSKNELRVVQFDGHDAFHYPGSRGLGIIDGVDGKPKALMCYPGGTPYPKDADNNPWPPHEVLDVAQTIHFGNETWVDVASNADFASNVTTHPVLDATTPGYSTMEVRESGMATGVLGYVNQTGYVGGNKNAISIWIYLDEEDRIIPPYAFSLAFSTAAALNGVTTGSTSSLKMLPIPIPIFGKRWTNVCLDWDNDGALYSFLSYGIHLSSLIPSACFVSGALSFRLDRIQSGVTFNLNRIGPEDRVAVGSMGVNKPILYFGTPFNEELQFDGTRVGLSGVRAPWKKPIQKLAQNYASAATALFDGTAAFTIPAAQSAWVASDAPAVTADTTVEDGTGAWAAGVDAQTVVTASVTTAPVAPLPSGGSGTDYQQAVFTKTGATVPAVGLLDYRNVAGTIPASGFASVQCYWDFLIEDLTLIENYAGTQTIFFPKGALQLAFYTNATPTDSTTPVFTIDLNQDMTLGSINQFKKWMTLRKENSGSAIPFAAIGLKLNASFSTAMYSAAGSNFALRFDNVITGVLAAPDGRFARITVTRQGELSAIVGSLAYVDKSASSFTISANKSIQFKAKLEKLAAASGGFNGAAYIPAKTLRLQFNSAATFDGTDLTGGGDHGLVNGVIGDGWQTFTVSVPAAGISTTINSIGFKLESALPILLSKTYQTPQGPFVVNGTFYAADATNNVGRLCIDDIRIVDSSGGAAQATTNKLQFAFAWRREDGAVSNLSPLSDFMGVIGGQNVEMDLSGFKQGEPSGFVNQNPDPYHIYEVDIYCRAEDSPEIAPGIPRLHKATTIGVPAVEGNGSMIVALGAQIDFSAVLKNADYASFENGVPPPCGVMVRDGDRLLRAAQEDYLVGELEVDGNGARVASAVDSGAVATTPVIGAWMTGRQLIDATSGDQGKEYTVAAVIDDNGTKKIVLATGFDPVANEWIGGYLGSAAEFSYILKGQKNRVYWSNVNSFRGPKGSSVPLSAYKDFAMEGEGVVHLGKTGPYVAVFGRTKFFVMKKREGVFDNVPTMGAAYGSFQEISGVPGIVAPLSFLQTTTGIGLWVAEQGRLMAGTVENGFNEHPLSSRLFNHLTDNTLVDAEGLRQSWAAWDRAHAWYVLFAPEAR